MGVIVHPFESCRVDFAVVDFATVDLDFTPYSVIAGTYTPQGITQLEVRDTDMSLNGIVDNYEYLRYERKFYEPDVWECQVNRYKTNVSAFTLGGFIRFTSHGNEHIGIIEQIEKILDETGKGGEQWKMSGRGIEAILSQRIALNLTGIGTGYDTSNNTPAETAIRYYINQNCIDAKDELGVSDASRNFTGLTLEAVDQARPAASNVTYSARFQMIGDIITEICKANSLSCKLIWSGTSTNFEVQFFEGTDRTATVFFSPEVENVQSFLYQNSNSNSKNLLYLGGDGTADTRALYEGYTGTIPTGWSRRETFLDASDCSDNVALATKSASSLAELGEDVSLEMEYLPSNTFTYGTDFDLGDLVKVVFPGVVTLESRIIGITIELDESGEKITMEIGKGILDMKRIFKAITSQTAAQVRR